MAVSIVVRSAVRRNDGDGGEVEEGEGWKVVVDDAESGINDMFEVENHLTWWWYLNFNRCTVR